MRSFKVPHSSEQEWKIIQSHGTFTPYLMLFDALKISRCNYLHNCGMGMLHSFHLEIKFKEMLLKTKTVNYSWAHPCLTLFTNNHG